jgi:uncharacterized protein (TIGR02996 family)
VHDPETLANLLRGTLLAPTDDLPRLILADFLDNHTDLDSTVLRMPHGTWLVRTLIQNIGHHNSAITYVSNNRCWNRWFSRDVLRIEPKHLCPCRKCEYVWCDADPERGVINPVKRIWRCAFCNKSRHQATTRAIKKATHGGISLAATG